MLAMVIVFALFLVMGTLFAFGKGGFLIAGWWRTDPKEGELWPRYVSMNLPRN